MLSIHQITTLLRKIIRHVSSTLCQYTTLTILINPKNVFDFTDSNWSKYSYINSCTCNSFLIRIFIYQYLFIFTKDTFLDFMIKGILNRSMDLFLFHVEISQYIFNQFHIYKKSMTISTSILLYNEIILK